MKIEIEYNDGLMTVTDSTGKKHTDVLAFSIEGGDPDNAQVSVTYHQPTVDRQRCYLDGTPI